MADYPEIPCNTIINKNGKSYQVRQFGFAGNVYEDHLIPIPAKKKIRTFNEDGTEDTAKYKEVPVDTASILVEGV